MPAKVAVTVKNCCAVFRATSSVESCTMSLGSESTLLSFALRCKGGVTKQSRLVAEQSHVHRALYDKMTPCRLSARPKLLNEIVANFGAGVEEVSLVPLATQLQLRTFVDEAVSCSLEQCIFDSESLGWSGTERGGGGRSVAARRAAADAAGGGERGL